MSVFWVKHGFQACLGLQHSFAGIWFREMENLPEAVPQAGPVEDTGWDVPPSINSLSSE